MNNEREVRRYVSFNGLRLDGQIGIDNQLGVTLSLEVSTAFINKDDAKAIVKHLTEQFKLDEPTVKDHAPVYAYQCPCIVCNGGKKRC